MHGRGHTARSAPDDAHAHGGMHHEACVAWQTIKKYIDLLQSVANRRERVVEIELDDVFNYFGGDEMAEKIRRNTYRYKQLICQAIDRCSSAQASPPTPSPTPSPSPTLNPNPHLNPDPDPNPPPHHHQVHAAAAGRHARRARHRRRAHQRHEPSPNPNPNPNQPGSP